MSNPKLNLESGNKYPYDEDDDGGKPIENANDWAMRAARGVIYDLTDRRKIKWGFDDVALDVRREIITSLAGTIRLSATQYVDRLAADLAQARTTITILNEKIDYLAADREPLASEFVVARTQVGVLEAALKAANADAERLTQLLVKLRAITTEHHEVSNIEKLSKIGWGDPCPVCNGGEIFVEVQAGINAHKKRMEKGQ